MIIMIKNNLIKSLSIFIIFGIFLYAFSASYSSHNITNLAYVAAIGFDVVDSSNDANSTDKSKIKISFQFVNPSALGQQNSASDSPSSIVNSVESTSINSAINLMNVYIGKELNLAHCKVIVFSEKFAESDISEEIYTLINNTQIRPTTNIVISKCDASYYIESSKPSLEQLVTKYYDIFPNSSKYTGYTSNITLGDFFNCLSCDSCNPTAILGGYNNNDFNQPSSNNINDSISNNSSIVGNRGAENIGLAVFDGGKLVGELTGIETLWHSLLQNDINNFVISIPDPKNSNKYIDLSLAQTKKTKVNVNVSSGTPYIDINISLLGKILTINDNSDYENESYLRELSSYANSYIQSNISDYLYKTSKDLKCDINEFGKFASKYFLTTNDWKNYDWLNNYENAFFTVNVDANIESGLLVSGT